MLVRLGLEDPPTVIDIVEGLQRGFRRSDYLLCGRCASRAALFDRREA